MKQLGDRTAELQRIRPGTRVFAEGPYGTFTTRRRRHERVLLVAGGIGITPLRAMLGQMSQRPESVTLLYRAATPDDVVFGSELERARARGVRVHLLVGTEIGGHRGWLQNGQAVPLIGSARFGRLYGAALTQIGVESFALDATDATIAGLKAARAQ